MRSMLMDCDYVELISNKKDHEKRSNHALSHYLPFPCVNLLPSRANGGDNTKKIKRVTKTSIHSSGANVIREQQQQQQAERQFRSLIKSDCFFCFVQARDATFTSNKTTSTIGRRERKKSCICFNDVISVQ